MQITRIPAQRENRKTRIAVYCRVSTKLEEQEESLETQRAAYTDLISLRSDWELVGVYADSLSGLSAEKRPEFMRMIDEAMAGNIDRILCKSVSRFSRNVAECKKYADLLRTRNVTVEFEKENLRTDDPTSSFIFSLMAAIAENESRSISENIRWGYQERFKRGEFNLGNNRILGYDTVNKKLVRIRTRIYPADLHAFPARINVEEIIRKLTDVGVKTRMVHRSVEPASFTSWEMRPMWVIRSFTSSRRGILSPRSLIRRSLLKASTWKMIMKRL